MTTSSSNRKSRTRVNNKPLPRKTTPVIEIDVLNDKFTFRVNLSFIFLRVFFLSHKGICINNEVQLDTYSIYYIKKYTIKINLKCFEQPIYLLED